MLERFIESKRTTEFPLLGFNIWLMKKLRLLLPKNPLKKTLCIVVHVLVTLFVGTQYMEMYFKRNDKEYVLDILKISLISMMCASKGNAILYWQKEWVEVIDYVTEHDKSERLTQNPARQKIIRRYTRQYSKLTYYYCILYICTQICVVLPNLFKYLSSPSFREMLRNGTEPFPHIFNAWVPFDDQKFPLNWMTVAWQTYACMMGGTQQLCFDLTVTAFMMFFGAEFELLRLSGAELMDGLTPADDEEFDERVRVWHSSHTKLMKNIELVNSILSPVMFLYVSSCGLLLCVWAFQLTNITTTSQKLVMVEFLTFSVTQLFLYCWMSNHVLDKSSELSWGPYSSAWYRGSARQRRTILLLAGKARATVVFSAGPFTDLNLPTFVTILKGAYSYYTIMRN